MLAMIILLSIIFLSCAVCIFPVYYTLFSIFILFLLDIRFPLLFDVLATTHLVTIIFQIDTITVTYATLEVGSCKWAQSVHSVRNIIKTKRQILKVTKWWNGTVNIKFAIIIKTWLRIFGLISVLIIIINRVKRLFTVLLCTCYIVHRVRAAK